MKWINTDHKVAIKSWCEDVEQGAMEQAINLANHPVINKPVIILPDCHQGYGMPIGCVVLCENALIPKAVGVDIGCGVRAFNTNVKYDNNSEKIRQVLDLLKKRVPVGEGKYNKNINADDFYDDFYDYFNTSKYYKGWYSESLFETAQKSLGTLGGGNHFLEIQKDEEDFLWLMLHSGSRGLGHAIATYYHSVAKNLNERYKSPIPTSELAFLPSDSEEGKDYWDDMIFALKYAEENRRRMMFEFKGCFEAVYPFRREGMEIDCIHNYAALKDYRYGDGQSA